MLRALREDITGRAQNHVVAVVECLIRLEASLDLWDETLRRSLQVPGLRVMGLGSPLVGMDTGLPCGKSGSNVGKVDMPALQMHVGAQLAALVRGFSDVLSRGECPLLQERLCADRLAQRLRKLN